MIHTFAIEPSVLSDPLNRRYFLEQFGVSKGRVIAGLPREWHRKVYRLLAGEMKDRERRLYEEQLLHLRKAVRPLDPPIETVPNMAEWLQYAEDYQISHEKPFRAIVAVENPREREWVIKAAEVNEGSPNWHVRRQDKVPRTPESLVEVSLPLLEISREVLLVDPYFDPSASRYVKSLRALMTALAPRARKLARVELHCFRHLNADEQFWKRCETVLPALIPEAMSLSVHRWSAAVSGERFHRRYVLTEQGGIAFEGGLDCGREGESTDVFLLEDELRLVRWAEYQADSDVFQPDPEGPREISGEAWVT
ncbi:hypothetical protein [Candidatus Laterigemmans baculatus]|uniref:hypothetical protein n=1 Tax=Candidatus Laterigemmans baculatus TaxID=2770505 RepID=UPI0013D9EE66|nr:hypothetical protein [Candidatus Laterigemmans baculatus]